MSTQSEALIHQITKMLKGFQPPFGDDTVYKRNSFTTLDGCILIKMDLLSEDELQINVKMAMLTPNETSRAQLEKGTDEELTELSESGWLHVPITLENREYLRNLCKEILLERAQKKNE